MLSTLRSRGVVENDKTAMSLFPSLYDDDVESVFTERNRGEKGVKAHSHRARLRPSTSVARCASTDVDARVRPSTHVYVRRRASTDVDGRRRASTPIWNTWEEACTVIKPPNTLRGLSKLVHNK